MSFPEIGYGGRGMVLLSMVNTTWALFFKTFVASRDCFSRRLYLVAIVFQDVRTMIFVIMIDLSCDTDSECATVWQGLRFWLAGLSKPTTPQKACCTVFRSTWAWERTVCLSDGSSCQRILLIEINKSNPTGFKRYFGCSPVWSFWLLVLVV